MSVPVYSAQTVSQNTLSYKYSISTKSKVIYASVLILLTVSLAGLPFVKTRISVKSPGLLQSSLEKTELSIPLNGRLVYNKLKDNQIVKPGDTLLVIDAALPQQQNALLQTRIVQIGQLLQDISRLLVSDALSMPKLLTGQYNASWQQFLQESENASQAKDHAERIFKSIAKRMRILKKNGQAF